MAPLPHQNPMTHKELTVGARVTLDRVVLILEEFRKHYPEMPVQMGVTLLTAALNPGLTVLELGKKAGIAKSAVSRHMETLGPHNPVKDVGVGFLSLDYDLRDRRKKLVHVSPAGMSVIDAVLEAARPH